MKKILCVLSALCATFFLSSCALLESTTLLPTSSSMDSLESTSSENESTESSTSVADDPVSESVETQSSVEETSSENDFVSESSEEETSSEESFESESSVEESSEEQSSSEEYSEEASEEPVLPEESSSEDKSVIESSSEDSEEPEEVVTYTYTDFTDYEKALFNCYVGEVLPFPATNWYAFEGYYDETDYENGINFYTADNTQADFNAYRREFTDYTLVKTYMDDYGDMWYQYKKDDIVVDMAYYYHEETYWIDVFVYSDLSDGIVDDNIFGDEEEPDDNKPDDNIGENEDPNAVKTVDFTQATTVKNASDLTYFNGGCPTTGSPAVLVVPVEFSNVTAASKGYTIEKLKAAFTGTGNDTDYYSVHDYYYTSSYGRLDLDITVLDTWFRAEHRSSYYEDKAIDYYGSSLVAGEQIILDEVVSSLSKTMDLSKFDSDNNGFIDSIVLIPTINVDAEKIFYWAFRYWNLYLDSNDNYYEYDGVSAYDYVWAPYQFLHQSVSPNNEYIYTNSSLVNTYTFIHEFGHVLGADDYYDTSYLSEDYGPLNGRDVMDALPGDHNPYTKFNYGWLTTSRLVTAETSVTLTLEDFSKNGDTIIIANNWDDDLGAYQEYFVLMYYKNTGLNGNGYGYFPTEGIVVYHVNATLKIETDAYGTYYYVANSNTHPDDPEGYGTENNLIEFVTPTSGEYIYGVGDSLSANTKDDNGEKISYTFTVDTLTSDKATITFVKNN